VKLSSAVRVAAVATAAIAAVYVIGAVAFNLVLARHMTSQTDARLGTRLAAARSDPSALSQPVVQPRTSPGVDVGDIDADSAPLFLWQTSAQGSVTSHSPNAPALPRALLATALQTTAAPVTAVQAAPVQAAQVRKSGYAFTASLASLGPFRLQLTRDGAGWLIAGQSVAGDEHTKRLLLYGEIITGPFLLLAMFGGLLMVGRRALAPVEQSRRRQLEFTADASHELRTPLSVIRAEADVALSAPREAGEYRDALSRIQGESQRLRQLVDDMLWLARFDARPPPPGDEPVDLAILAQSCADRFRAVGPAVSAETPDDAVLISAPPEWIDRLAGVLVDNACRHAGPHGKVRIEVRAHGSRVSLTVEDSGPGIPEAERPYLFDRFHRLTPEATPQSTPIPNREIPTQPSSTPDNSTPSSSSPGNSTPGNSSPGRSSPNGSGHGGAGLGLAIGDSIVRSTGGRWHIADSPLGGALLSVSWRHSQPHRT
jgi:signal transduction histidine kinase